MFKNAIIYTIATMPDASLNVLESLEPARFAPCLPSQPESLGWTEPRGEAHGPLCEAINGHMMLVATKETKKVPAAVIAAKLVERVKAIEDATGRKPGKKESRELKDEILFDLLPAAFPARVAIKVWVDPVNKRVVIDTASQAQADDACRLLVNSLPGLTLTMATDVQPGATMKSWLSGALSPASFGIETSCELKSTDESKTKVKYTHHNLDVPEIKDHLMAGMDVASLALSWQNRISFALTDTMVLKKLAFETPPPSDAGDMDSYDVDVFLLTTEMTLMLDDLMFDLTDAPVAQ
jgi:recombination associated protein RdgC